MIHYDIIPPVEKQKSESRFSRFMQNPLAAGTRMLTAEVLIIALVIPSGIFAAMTVSKTLQTNANLTTDLLAHYTFDDSTNSLADQSGNGNALTSIGTGGTASSTAYGTSGSYTVIVPAGITTYTVKTWGAGAGGGSGGNGFSGGAGGGSGFAQASISVTPGESLTVEVGTGGTGANTSWDGGNGGGYSSLKRSSTYLIQAGGGGGGGGTNNNNNGGAGGAGGGSSGVIGSAGLGGTANPGGPGTTSAGGAGGTGGGSGGDGTAGAANAGGDGGGGGSVTAGAVGGGGRGSLSSTNWGGGGGGGGGRFGGGGGEAGADSGTQGGGGGGGGSSLVTGTNTTETAGSGTTPGNSADADYVASAGVGGSAGTTSSNAGDGGAGRVVLSATVGGTPIQQSGKIGQGVSFNGITQYTTAGSISNIKSAAFWAKASTTAAIAQGLVNLTGTTVYISTSASKVISGTGFTSPTYYIDGAASSTPGLYDDKWHHVVVTGTANITGSQIEIGRANSVYFGGDMDDVRFYSTTLSASNILRLYQLGATAVISKTLKTNPSTNGSSLLAHWTFDGASPLTDRSGSGNTGTAGTASNVEFLTSGTSWTVPGNWNDSNNSIECIGAGGNGVTAVGDSGAGGGGGAYAKITNVDLTPAESVDYVVAAGGSQNDTYFNGAASSTASLSCAPGRNGSNATGGAGGAIANSTGDTEFAGGAGGAGGTTNQIGGGGGGGSAGPTGAGKNGGIDSGGNGGGGGGAGSNGGSSSAGANATGTTGATGGNGTDGTGGGAGGSTSTSGTAGTSGKGAGGGGSGWSNTESVTAGGAGSVDTAFDGSHGASGGGGGGGGAGASRSGDGGAGGTYGGGGGGGGHSQIGTDGTGGNGGQGIIVITNGVSGGTSIASGKIGQAMTFNGASQFITSGSVSSIKSVAFWAKASTTAAIAQGLVNLTGTTVYISTSASKVLSGTGFTSPIYYIDGAASSTPGLYDDKWHHVVVTGTANITGSQIEMGRANSVYFGGSMDDVSLYSTTLSANDALRLYGLGNTTTVAKTIKTQTATNGSSLIGHWTFDGPNMLTSVLDSSGNGNHASIPSGIGTTTVAGKIGQALSFNGTTQYVTAGSISNIKSAAFWAKASSTVAIAQGLLNLTGTTVYISTSASKVLSATGFTSPVYYVDGAASSTPGLYDANWHHVVVAGTADITGSQTEIGRANSVYFGGTMDDVRLYSTTLSAGDILKLYNAGK